MRCVEPEVAVPLRRALSRHFKHDLDEFSLSLHRLAATVTGCRVAGRFHVYAEGSFRFEAELLPTGELRGLVYDRLRE